MTLGEAGLVLEDVSQRLQRRDPDWQPNAMMLKVWRRMVVAAVRLMG